MPHIHLETTADLPENAQIPDILEALMEVLERQETVAGPAVKAYHTLRSNWTMGTGAPPGFAHCTAMILTGRPVELRRQIADAIYAVMQEQFAQSLEAGEVSVTLEIREMERETYRKN